MSGDRLKSNGVNNPLMTESHTFLSEEEMNMDKNWSEKDNYVGKKIKIEWKDGRKEVVDLGNIFVYSPFDAQSFMGAKSFITAASKDEDFIVLNMNNVACITAVDKEFEELGDEQS